MAYIIIEPTPVKRKIPPTLENRFAPGQCIILNIAPKTMLAIEIQERIIPITKSVFIQLFDVSKILIVFNL